MGFFGYFLCLEGEKPWRKTRQRAKLRKNGLFQVWKVPGAFDSPGMNFKAATFKCCQLQTSSDWIDLTPLEISWLLVSEKVWILKIQWLDQKLWLSEVSGASIGTLSRFLWYLGYPNSDFDPWIVFGMRIWLSYQWHWFQPILTTWSKFEFLGSLGSTPGQTRSNLVKFVKNLWEAWVWCKTMKNVVLWEFWPRLTAVRLNLINHLVGFIPCQICLYFSN